LIVRLETLSFATLVILEGRLDFGAAPGFQQHLEQALSGTPVAVVVDCAALEYVSSAGLRVFLVAARVARQSGIRFAACALTPPVREVFEVSGFTRIIEVHPDREVALARAPAPPA
jgi:anti-anti-sigma factor